MTRKAVENAYYVTVAFSVNDEEYGRVKYVVNAATMTAARKAALILSEDSHYDDERLPDRQRRVVECTRRFDIDAVDDEHSEDVDDAGYDGDEMMRHSSRGWSIDRDGWWSRPIRRRDRIDETILNRRTFAPGLDCHVILQAGHVLCRNARQKRAIDNSRYV